jgi:hypothetical protein
MLEVPSANRIESMVLTTILCGEERNPRESRIVTVTPGSATLDRRTTALCEDVSTCVLTRTNDVLPYTMIGSGEDISLYYSSRGTYADCFTFKCMDSRLEREDALHCRISQ